MELQSVSGLYTLQLQTDGNLVLFAGFAAIWNTSTAGSGMGTYLVLGKGTQRHILTLVRKYDFFLMHFCLHRLLQMATSSCGVHRFWALPNYGPRVLPCRAWPHFT